LKLLAIILLSLNAYSNPHPNESLTPKDKLAGKKVDVISKIGISTPNKVGLPVIRVNLVKEHGLFVLKKSVIEYSATKNFYQKSSRLDSLGSFKASLTSSSNPKEKYYGSIGTGYNFASHAQGLSFRFPLIKGKSVLTIFGENSDSGKLEQVFSQTIDSNILKEFIQNHGTNVSILKQSKANPPILLNLYAEGYGDNESDRKRFYRGASSVIAGLKSFPSFDQFEIRAVFYPSNLELGSPKNLRTKIVRDSFLGLYYPYWSFEMGRWYNVVYPTDYTKLMDGFAQLPYDYAMVLIKSRGYWGMGNYNFFTAIPDANRSFTYLLHHEFGHFFGLQEEYSSGGTELLFGKNTVEPWSQNLTFQGSARSFTKWASLLKKGTPIPTTGRAFQLGVFRGGYAGVSKKSHIPAKNCTMGSGRAFCEVCAKAISRKIGIDQGK
jgi:hypothetical protein